MKIHVIALSIAVVLAVSMAVAGDVYGGHSLPGIFSLLANLPGLGVAFWVAARLGKIGESNFALYVISVLVNWVFYFYLIKGATFLKRKFSN